jgi:hypothetical protein
LAESELLLAESSEEDFEEGNNYDVYNRYESIVTMLKHASSISA